MVFAVFALAGKLLVVKITEKIHSKFPYSHFMRSFLLSIFLQFQIALFVLYWVNKMIWSVDNLLYVKQHFLKGVSLSFHLAYILQSAHFTDNHVDNVVRFALYIWLSIWSVYCFLDEFRWSFLLCRPLKSALTYGTYLASGTTWWRIQAWSPQMPCSFWCLISDTRRKVSINFGNGSVAYR